ncbi:LysR family transcriptional regulator [Glaciimonas sp. CA11.2]|uniref:LysR family transcriptional regulator n=1 Tax=unclassified Glaciimonas TaxID=2644401 RepID=UPI002AB48BAA|nr:MULTISPECIES: LysR family transcriptional regulator [unclassified Glaciimonas]MDY7547438.1 LysR family transcriptional regulator [Glaciimonas sp. CA11.2]MEB0013547.1 LysR family transcriptional regulator [Glaciimonas sp. Cout2]MEB0083252.1 LysR family transcriptional regulator [Glaciimonas sp. Gout2]MEB0164700.1 LysR family transcriptional regulator [Glaciimonas sp. CA11.2]
MLNRLEMLRIFCVAAEAISFKEAAIKLGISPQAVTRAVRELERLQGELLFHRNTRNVQITAYGEMLATRASQSVAQLDGLFVSADETSELELEGLITLTAPSVLGRQLLLPALTLIAKQHPQLRFDLRLSDRHADVVSEKIDIGVRMGYLRDSRFVARQVAKVRFHVVATPGLFAEHGDPKHIEDLNALPTTAMFDRDTGRPWPWLFAGGQQSNPPNARFICDDAEAELAAVLSGLAYGQIPGFLVEKLIAAGELIPVMEKLAPEPWGLFVYRPQRGPVPARIRLVFDALILALSDEEPHGTDSE